MNKNLKKLFAALLVLVSSIFVGIIVIATNEPEFKIVSVTNKNTVYSIKYNKVKNAKSYTIEIFDKNNNKITKYDTDDTSAKIEINNLLFNEKYRIKITAHKKNKKNVVTKNDYNFTWEEPSFATSNSILLNNDDYNLKINGNLKKDDYHLVLKDVDKIIYDEIIKDNTYVIPKKVYKDKKMMIKAYLYIDDICLSDMTLYNKTNPILDLKLKTPKNNTNYTSVQDIKINFSGGENAEELSVVLYENNKQILQQVVTEKEIVIPKDNFKFNKKYKIVVKATIGEFEKNVTTNINFSSGIKTTTTKKTTKKVTTKTTKKSAISTPENLTNYKAGSADAIISIAELQIGNKGGQKFWSWYGYKGRVAWCAIFVSWSARHSGATTDIIPNFINTGVGARWFKDRDQWHYSKYKGGNYTPKKGDIIFFDWDPNDRIDHVGIVKGVKDGKVITIEGNTNTKTYSGGIVAEKSYDLTSNHLYGFGTPKYN